MYDVDNIKNKQTASMKNRTPLLRVLQQFVNLLLIALFTLILATVFWPWLEQIRYSWQAEHRDITPRGELAEDEKSTIECLASIIMAGFATMTMAG